MGPAVEEASKEILSDVLKCLTNNMKHMGECTLAAALYKMKKSEDVRKTAEGCLFEILRVS
ncbi:unnamed protein product [Arabidopsis thaliana]|uniref:Uncharacterized protein n=1 Tax=Arabidopsis thaliana TaxID=3702 RepID=A0A5S9XGH6_ARATH|nr:unnamed protein product [Arabidopsis thaliana]VYS58877.1 unnamed protein product [Arabidopsis thaliana]